MNQRRQFISDQYHFVAEVILIAIIVGLPIYYYYDWIPTWYTLIPILPLCVIFTWLERKEVDYKRYYFISPFLFGSFFFLTFPIFLSMLLSLLIVWRYLRIRRLLLIGRETRYIFLTSLFALIVYYITDKAMSVGLLILQLIILLFGYMLSHIAIMEKKKRNLGSYHVVLYTGIFLLLGGLTTFWASAVKHLLVEHGIA